jgi:hypothetical protein
LYMKYHLLDIDILNNDSLEILSKFK